MSRIELGQYRLREEEHALHALIELCVAMVGATIQGNDVRIVVEAVDPAWMVRADGRALRQILINLLSNAVKFTPNGGLVTVAAARGAGGAMVIDVVDTGCGIPTAEQAQVFQAFRSMADGRARRGGGAGLGLWISRSLVELHDGTLVLDSAEGKGTRATISIPSSRVHLAPPQADQTSASGGLAPQRRRVQCAVIFGSFRSKRRMSRRPSMPVTGSTPWKQFVVFGKATIVLGR